MKTQISFILGAALSLFVTSAHADSAWSRNKATTHASVDLNSDGKMDSIKLDSSKGQNQEETPYKLNVNDVTIAGSITAMAEQPRFFIADINRQDRFKEVVVKGAGEVGDSYEMIYWYDGHTLQLVAKMDGNSTFNGDGTVSVGSWNDFWTKNEIYKLDQKHHLIQVPQQYYSVNKKGAVSQKLSLKKQPDVAGVAATLSVGTKITVVKANRSDWYYVRASNGNAGWMRAADVHEHISGLPFAG